MTDTPSHTPLRRVLILKFWALGDLLIATPLLTALRAAHPGVHITWMADQQYGELLRGHPDINDLWLEDTGHWRRLLRRGNIPDWLKRTRELRNRVQAGGFDTVINCHPEKWWTALICVAPERVGLYPLATLPPVTSRWYTTPIAQPQNPPIHDTCHYLNVAQALGCPATNLHLTIGETDDEALFVRRFEAEHGLMPETPLVVLAPFTTSETKCWEPEGYAAVAAALPRRYPGMRIVLTLGPNDSAAAQQIADQAMRLGDGPPPILATGTGLREYVALLRRAQAVVCGDTSALHMAAALGTPYVAIFGQTDPARLAPLAGNGHILSASLPCSPCWSHQCSNPIWRECMKRITPEQVLDALAPYLDSGASNRRRVELHVK